MLDSSTATRPKAGGIAFPFKLGHSLADHGRNASLITLKSDITALPTPKAEATEAEKGLRVGMESGAGVEGNAGIDKVRKEEGGAGKVEDGTSSGETKPVRPTVERFETAQEDLD